MNRGRARDAFEVGDATREATRLAAVRQPTRASNASATSRARSEADGGARTCAATGGTRRRRSAWRSCERRTSCDACLGFDGDGARSEWPREPPTTQPRFASPSLAPSDVDKMKGKARRKRRETESQTGTHTNSPTRNAHTRCARKTLFVFLFLQKTQIRPPRAPGSAGPERGRRRAPMATRAGGHVAALPLSEPPPRARARPRHVFTSRSQKTSKSLFAIRANSRRASAAHHLRGAIRLLERNRLVFGDRRR